MNITGSKSIIIYFLLFINSLFSTYANSTLNSSNIFRDNGDSLISPTGNFELGFFSPDGSSNRYVGIWYKKIPVTTVVWVFNRDNPLTDRSGALRVAPPGLLLLQNATNGSVIWSTNTSRSVQSPVADLLDTGNLVVRDANDDNPDNFLWQSFDYPTDTFLAGMKLGKNFVTGLEVYFTSPKNDGNPASGDYTYHCDPTGYPQDVLKKGGDVTYRTGPWNGEGFSGMPTLQKNPNFDYDMVIDDKEVYYHYAVVNNSVITRITLSASGDVQRWFWDESTQEWKGYLSVPVDKCDIYNGCGPYGSCNIKNYPTCDCLDKFKPRAWSNGCIRRTPLNCQQGDVFLKYSGIKLPDTRNSRYNKSMTLKECKVACSRNCACTAYTSLDISRGGNGCLLWFDDLVDMREISPGQDIYIRMASSELDSRPWQVLIVTLPLVIVLTLVILILLLCSRKGNRLDHQQPKTGKLRHKLIDYHPDQSLKDLELPLFDPSTIAKATDNFSSNNKLGQGGFGPVYKEKTK